MNDRDIILKEFAKSLDGGEYDDFPIKEQCREAKEKHIMIIYGASDDLCEMAGAVRDEFGCFNGAELFVNSKGFLQSECKDEYCPYFASYLRETGTKIKVIWGGEPTWRYETEITHEKFNIYEDGEVFCEGIVFYADDLKRG